MPQGSWRGCLKGNWSAAAVRVGQDRVRRPPRYPRYRPGPTGRHRRGPGDMRSPAQGRFSYPCRTTWLGNFPAGGGLGSGGDSRDGASRPPPTAGSWLHSFLFLTLGPRTLSHCCGVEKPKGAELLESAARGWSSRRGCKARSRRSSRPRHSKGDCVVPAGGFSLRFPSSRRGLRSFTSLHSQTHRR